MAEANRPDIEREGHRAGLVWRPVDGNDSSRFVTCRNGNCGNEHVDPAFARVFGDRSGTVVACPECTPWTEIKEGAAALPADR